jgi:hypothetical protein
MLFLALSNLCSSISIALVKAHKSDATICSSEIFRVYYEENDIERIVIYCQKDTIAVAQIILRLRGEALLETAEIAYI